MFLNYVIAKEKFKPDFFLYENNHSISQDIKDEISKELGQPIQMINAALVSAQQRKRIWVHNIPNVEQPKDRGLVVKDILEDDIVEEELVYYIRHTSKREMTDPTKPIRVGDIHGNSQEHRVYSPYGKSVNLMANGGGQGAKTGLYMTPIKLEEIDPYYWKGGIGNTGEPKLVGMIKNNGTYLNGKQPSQQYRIYSGEDKGICLNTGKSTSGIYIYKTNNENVAPVYYVKDKTIIIDGEKYYINLPDGCYVVRKLTPVEAERLQTLPDNYTYEEGQITVANECDVTLNGEIVTGKTVVNSIRYTYDANGQLTKKTVIPASGEAQTVYYENSEDANTVVKFTAGGGSFLYLSQCLSPPLILIYVKCLYDPILPQIDPLLLSFSQIVCYNTPC